MIRTCVLGTLAAMLLATPALAQNKPVGPMTGPGMPSTMAVPGLVSTNVGNATNVGAGIGNSAQQQGVFLQGGGGAPIRGVSPLVSTNVGTATNVAAGIGNSAGQRLLGVQGSGVQVGLNFSGRGPLVSTNVGVGTNVTAGIGNTAAQSLTGLRR